MIVSRETRACAEQRVSRETRRPRHVPRETRRRWPIVALTALGFAAAVACGAPPGPRGWAAAQPAVTDAGEVVLAPHKKTLYAVHPGAGDVAWQFPAKDKDNEPLSDSAKAVIKAAVADAGLDAAAADALGQRVDVATVGGDALNSLLDALDATSAADNAKSDLEDLVRSRARDERDAVKGVRALYGDIGLSTDGDTAFVPTYGGWVHALDVATGRPLWVTNLDSDLIGGVEVEGDMLYVGTRDGDVFSLDAGQGIATRLKHLKGEIWAAPTVEDGQIFVTTLDGSLYKLNLSGDEQWRFGGPSAGIAARAVVSNDRVYVGAFDNTLYAVQTETGKEIWKLDAGNWFWSEPIDYEGTLYAASLDGKVYAVDAETGEPRWAEPFDAGSPIRGALTVAADAVIVAGRDGYVHKVGLADGEELTSSLQIGTRMESDLTAGEGDQVYAKPRDKVVWIIDAGSTPLAGERYILPD